MKKHVETREAAERAPSRRAFLQHAAGTGLATVAGLALLPGKSHGDPFNYIRDLDQNQGGTKPGTADLITLNFLLLVERLEARFYALNADKSFLTGPASGTSLQVLAVGEEVVPPVTTTATAFVRFTLLPDQTKMTYDARASNLSGTATGMHVNRGARGAVGDVVYPLEAPDASGAATGTVTVSPEDLDPLLHQGFYLQIDTAAHPNGEVRGQLIPASPGTTTSTTPTLKLLVDEILPQENAHVALLEQTLGVNADPAPTFQNLEASTLDQFVTMAQTLEDLGASAYLGQLPLIRNTQLLITASEMMAVQGRHAGGLRAYRKVASTNQGGDPNVTLTEDQEALNRMRTREQVLAVVHPYLVGSLTTP